VSQAEMPPSSLRVQTVAHAFTPATLLRYVEALAQSLHNARVAGLLGATVVATGRLFREGGALQEGPGGAP